MKSRLQIFVTTLSLMMSISSTFSHPPPLTLLYDGSELMALKAVIPINDPQFESAYINLINDANNVLESPCDSVMDKTVLPPSCDKHDYISLARYWWPNRKIKGGRPYIRKDGIINPEIWLDTYDYNKKCKMSEACKLLCLAYYLTGNESYAACAGAKIKAWFLDPDTAMKPHLNFAQGIPGKQFSRAAGIIESSSFISLFDLVLLLKGSKFWSSADQLKLEMWIKEYLRWLLNSANGKEESLAKNNHGSWYDLQVIYYALYTHQKEFAKVYLKEHVYPRMLNQFKYDGSQPFELIRTRSFYYSIYNLQALFCCARIGKWVEEDIWRAGQEGNETLRKGLNYLLDFALNKKKWMNPDIEPVDPKLLAQLLLAAAKGYGDSMYMLYYRQIMGEENTDELFRLLYPAPFF